MYLVTGSEDISVLETHHFENQDIKRLIMYCLANPEDRNSKGKKKKDQNIEHRHYQSIDQVVEDIVSLNLTPIKLFRGLFMIIF